MLTRAFAGGALIAIIFAVTPLRAQTGAAPDFSNVEIHSLHVQGNVWMLVGGPFNAAVSIGNDGVLIVDTMVEPLADRLLAEVKKIAAGPDSRRIAERYRVRRLRGKGLREHFVQLGRPLHRFVVMDRQSGIGDRGRNFVAVIRRQ